jgi:hypothetical protein
MTVLSPVALTQKALKLSYTALPLRLLQIPCTRYPAQAEDNPVHSPVEMPDKAAISFTVIPFSTIKSSGINSAPPCRSLKPVTGDGTLRRDMRKSEP